MEYTLACAACSRGECPACIGTIGCTCYAYSDEHRQPRLLSVPAAPYGMPAYSDLDELDVEHDRGGKEMP